MYTIEMTRERLKECIERGITMSEAWDTALHDSEEIKLRAVGETTKHVAYGTWAYSNEITCGCPLVEAGLSDPIELGMRIPVRYRHFCSYYDMSVRDYLYQMGVTVDIASHGVIHVKG